MASRKPDLRLPIPAREDGKFQRPPSSLRSPRFIEDFNAPFSEAIMNASVTTLATTDINSPSTSPASRTSFGGESGRPSVNLKRPSTMQLKSPSTWQDAANGIDSKRRSNVNDRIREWARKSWGTVRKGSDEGDGYFDRVKSRRQGSVVTCCSPDDIAPNETDGHGRTNTCSKAVVTVTELPK
ncbi:Fc.00g062420.m01.CDS01 [Cosmosporella sp. VM-42]